MRYAGRGPIEVVSSDVTMKYGDETVLDVREEFRVSEGLTLLQGPSGSGKSTFLNIMSGFVKPTTGEIRHRSLEGGDDLYVNRSSSSLRSRVVAGMASRLLVESWAERRESAYRSKYTGYISQQPALHPNLTMEDYISILHKSRGSDIDSTYLDSIIAKLGIGRLLKKRPRELSGGEEQRGAIVAAIAHKPSLIFADEPTSALDSENKDHTIEILHVLSNTGSNVIVVSHDDVPIDMVDRTVNMVSGRIVEKT